MASFRSCLKYAVLMCLLCHFAGEVLILSGVSPKGSHKKVWGYASVKDPAALALLEHGEEVYADPVFEGSVLPLVYSQSFFGSKARFFWPQCCCLCLGPVERREMLLENQRGVEVRADDVPYCNNCYQKMRGFLKREKPGAVIINTAPPTFAFRNEKYLKMFMEANRAR